MKKLSDSEFEIMKAKFIQNPDLEPEWGGGFELLLHNRHILTLNADNCFFFAFGAE